MYKLSEMAYPTNFDLEFFSNLPTFTKRKQYCDERLQKLGSGSSRIAYKVDDQKVLKIAKNGKGLAQNEQETDWYRNNYECNAEIFEADTDNYTWIEMELARKAKPSDFKRLLGITFEQFTNLLIVLYNQYASNANRFPIRLKDGEELAEKMVYDEDSKYYSEYLANLNSYLTDYQVSPIQDLLRYSNWGIVNRNGQEVPVIIDNGLSEEILKNYYKR